MNSGDLDPVDRALEAAAARSIAAGEREIGAEFVAYVAEARADVQPEGAPGFVADAVGVRHGLEGEEKAPRLDGGLEIGDGELVVDDRRVAHQIEVAVE